METERVRVGEWKRTKKREEMESEREKTLREKRRRAGEETKREKREEERKQGGRDRQRAEGKVLHLRNRDSESFFQPDSNLLKAIPHYLARDSHSLHFVDSRSIQIEPGLT